MTWITKDLTLDLLAIGIHTLTKISERIAQEPNPDVENWPPAQHQQQVEPPAQPQQREETPAAEPPAPAPEPAMAPSDEQELRTEAQTVLRTIALADGGTTWISGTLFPQFGVTTLTDVTADQLPALIAKARDRAQEVAA